jgi:hypothetical protein
MSAKTAAPVLSSGDKVIASAALRGVPLGTPGKVIHVQGLSWIRYWVWFENGERVGTLDRAKLATPAEWDRKQNGGDELVVVASGESTAVAASDGAGAVLESVNGIPGHLVERSRLARERWAAKHG